MDAQILRLERADLIAQALNYVQYREVVHHGNGNCSKTYSKTDDQE